jgi:hypothetical protein
MSTLTEASRQWATRPSDQRFQSLEALFQSVRNRQMRSRAADIPLAKIEAKVSDDGQGIQLNHGINAVQPTHWSMGQLSTWIEAPAGYLRTLSPALAVDNINYGLQKVSKNGLSNKAKNDVLKFMSIVSEDESPNTLQAVTSTTYGRIWDVDVVKCAMNLQDKSNGKFHNPLAYNRQTGAPEPSGLYASDRDVFIFMIDGGSMLEVGPRAKMNRGFFLSNSETGSRIFKLTTFLFNHCCGNHFVYGADDIATTKIRHTGGGPARFEAEAGPALLAYANASVAPIETAIRKAQDYLLPLDEKELLAWFTNRKFTRTEALESIDYARREEGDCRTLWQAVQGATAYARGFAHIDARVALETTAGELMDLVK